MRDTARQVELISLPLRLTMVADRAEAAIERFKDRSSLDEDGRAALNRVVAFIDNAGRGFEITRSTKMSGYSREAISAYRISEKAMSTEPCRPDATDTKQFLDVLRRDIQLLIKSPSAEDNAARAERLREFFKRLAQVCLSLNVRTAERVSRAEGRRIPT